MLFFFQAEDGIRDVAVTGVQTCALPISHDVDVRLGLDQPENAPVFGRDRHVLALPGLAAFFGESIDFSLFEHPGATSREKSRPTARKPTNAVSIKPSRWSAAADPAARPGRAPSRLCG